MKSICAFANDLHNVNGGYLVIGIRAEDLPRVFEKGFTGYNGREENRSTGIGLYLCGKIMKRLDHGIRIESELGKGTKVFLELERKKMDLY